jgi:hypothetical protein
MPPAREDEEDGEQDDGVGEDANDEYRKGRNGRLSAVRRGEKSTTVFNR